MTGAAARGYQEPHLEQFLFFLQKSPFNMLLFGLAVTTGGMLLWPLISRSWRQTQEVGTFEAVQLINRRDALGLDVRDTGEFAAGHITNAKHIPAAQLPDRVKEIEKHKSRPIIVSCGTGSRAPAGNGAVRKQGFAGGVALRGGLAAGGGGGPPPGKN